MTETSTKYVVETQLTIPDIDSESVSISFSDSDAKTAKQQALQRYLDNGKEPIACVNVYSPGKRNTKYFRLSYRAGKKMKHTHIRGGSTISELAIYRAKKLQSMIDRGAELAEVIAAVQDFNSGR